MALRLSSQHSLDLNSPLPTSKKTTSKKTIEQTFTKLSQLEHVLLRPDTYIGSAERMQQQVWVWDEAGRCMKYKEITFPPGLYKIFDEILVNAADHKQRDPAMNCIKVEIDTENQMISVWNNGAGIPVEVHQKEKMYVPELIFGNLLTSSNYDDDEKKVVGGRNGFGAKLANIFSTEFIVETADASRGKCYKQIFRNNMGSKEDPIIRSNPKKESYTKISFSPDLARFGMNYLDEDVVSLLKKRVYDIAGISSGLKVFLNGARLPIKNFKSYVDLYPRGDANSDVYYERISDRWEVAITASDGQLNQVSFVNSIWTIKGGTHVAHIADQIVSKVADFIAKKNKGLKVKPFQIKSHLSLYVNCLIENPSFDSQTKETLTTKPAKFGSKWSFSEELAKKVQKSAIIDNVLAFARFKQNKELTKTDGGKKARVLGVPKLEDANRAGSREAVNCTLILTEGDSAKALAISGLSVVGRDYYGVFPLRGKLLNVREAKHKQIMDNAEINNLKKILGLQHNKTYSEETIKSLRYGHVLIMADQDHDGSHIKGLVINFFDHFWPSLLKVDGFLQEFITPIVKCIKGTQDKVFFTLPEYKQWVSRDVAETGKWKPKYYKGLGTSTAAEAKNYFSNLPRHLHEFQSAGDEDSDMIELAFSKQRVGDRKDWLSAYTPGTFFDHGVDELSYSNFVNKELILFSVADNARSIPNVIDGLKPSQRKVLFACFKRKLTKSEIKVAQLAGYIAEHAAYHHGEMSLQATIVGLAQNFVGSNNSNLLVPAGQFGTRLQGGKDAASSRYIFTKLAPIARALFPELDDPLLSYLEDDGLSIEPEWYCPVIPMVLVNGSDGIGTGWSSSVPCYNPRDLIQNIRNLLSNEPLQPMHPWYRGFTGAIVPVDNSKSFDIYGRVRKSIAGNSFKIDELPIRSWTTPYKEFLESNVIGNSDAKTPFIKDFHDNSTENKVSFTISIADDFVTELSSPFAYRKLKLGGSITTSNMVLFDGKGRIRKYDTPEEILHEFFETRLELYKKRRAHILAELSNDLNCLSNKQRFILMVVEGELIVAKRKKIELLADLKRLKFDPIEKKKVKKASSAALENSDDDAADDVEGTSSPLQSGYDYLLSMPLWSLTMERVEELGKQRDRKAAERNAMDAKTPRELWETDLDFLEEAITKDDDENAVMAADLDRVARNARTRQRKGAGRAKGRKGKGSKAASYAEESDVEDFENVPLPLARSIAPKKLQIKKVQPSIARKPSAGTTKKRAVKSAKKVATKMVLDDDEISDGSELEESSAEFSNHEDDIVDLLEDVALDSQESKAKSSHEAQEKMAPSRPKRRVKPVQRSEVNRMSFSPNVSSEEEHEVMASDVKSRIKKYPEIICKEEDIKSALTEDGSADDEKKDTKNSGRASVFDFDEDSEGENSLSLSERLAQRLKVTDSLIVKKPVVAKATEAKGNRQLPRSSAAAGAAPKRQRESKKKPAPVDEVSPSKSPKPKKTRVKGPKKAATRKVIPREVESGNDESSGAELDAFDAKAKEALVKVAPRPRRQRAATRKVVIVDSDDEDDEDGDFIDVDDDDSDFE